MSQETRILWRMDFHTHTMTLSFTLFQPYKSTTSYPLDWRWGQMCYMWSQTCSRQPVRATWSHKRLEHAQVLALRSAIGASSAVAYSSALNSYISFCRSHNFPIDPTPDTLSFYTVYMAHHIKLSLVDSYLSGICNELKSFHPNVQKNRQHQLVTKTLRSCKKLCAVPTTQKRPLSQAELADLQPQYMSSSSHNDLLFFIILLVGFHALMWLGELVSPDSKTLQDFQKVMKHDTVEQLPEGFAFFLPGHKADKFFEGNRVLLQCNSGGDNPDRPFCKYLQSRDKLFPFHPQLWLRANSSVPTRGWFIRHLHQHFPSDIGGHSLRAGGATALAQAGIPPHIIQAISCWASNMFQIYICHHPVLLAALLFSNTPSSHWLSCFYHTLFLLFLSLPTFVNFPSHFIALYGTHFNTMPPFGPAADFRAVLCAPIKTWYLHWTTEAGD